MVEAGSGLAVMGNHDEKFLRCLSGGSVNLPPSAQLTLDQYDRLGVAAAIAEKSKAYKLLTRIPHHLVLDGGRLVVAHAGLPLRHHGQVYRHARKIAVYGRRERGADGVEIPRTNFALEKHYSGQATVVQGHVTVSEIVPINRVWRIDTGCVFGGRLTAPCYPEMEIISVPALRNYWPTTEAGSHFPNGD